MVLNTDHIKNQYWSSVLREFYAIFYLNWPKAQSMCILRPRENMNLQFLLFHAYLDLMEYVLKHK